jgi:hypothetical protein
MSRASSLFVATAAVVALIPSSVLPAQRATPPLSALSPASTLLATPRESSAEYLVRMTPIASTAATPAAADDGEPGVVGRTVRALVGVGVGAAVGGWLGYFGAQVTNSDWARITSQEKTNLRQSYTVVGLGVGGLLGYFMRPKAHAPSRLPQPFNVPARTGRLLLAKTELRRSIATNALEAVEMGRPEWIQQQRADEAKLAGQTKSGPIERTSLVVYVGDEKVGAIETLRDIAIPEVAELRFYDARDARRRWGVEHKYGAIEVVPAGASSTAATRVEMPAGQ